MSRRIAIIGDALTTRHLAPFDDPSWEIWAQGAAHTHVPRADRYFELHGPALVKRDKDEAAIRAVGETLGARYLYLHPDLFDTPDVWKGPLPLIARQFPFDAVLAQGRRYFTSSFAWMIGFALLHDDISEIGLWGADMDEREEYFHQRACVNYWLGRAEQRGITVTLPRTCVIMSSPYLYALEDEANAAQLSIYDERKALLEAQRARHRAIADEARRVIEQCQARLDELDKARESGEVTATYHGERDAHLHREITKAEEALEASIAGEVQFLARIEEADYYRTQHAIPEAPPKPRALEAVS